MDRIRWYAAGLLVFPFADHVYGGIVLVITD